MLFSDLEKICNQPIKQLSQDREITTLITDSRKVIVSTGSVFFAIEGIRQDGHLYISNLYKAGIRQFVIEKDISLTALPEANTIQVKSTTEALQAIAAFHRAQFTLPVIGITGSNGKTIIKEWLYQLLCLDKKVVKNPGSYNSQIGVPLSIWGIQEKHDVGIFEAGISKPNEMEKLQKIIQPTIGIFTNVGTAHDEGFIDRTQKIREKLKLFVQAKKIIFCADHSEVLQEITSLKLPTLSWGFTETANIQIRSTNQGYELTYQSQKYQLKLPFTNRASVENSFHIIALLLYFKMDWAVIQSRIMQLESIPMRLELKKGINDCQLIDDTYNNDLAGLKISLDFLSNFQKENKTVILSDILQSSLNDEDLCALICQSIVQSGVNKFIGIGPVISAHQELFKRFEKRKFYDSTAHFLKEFSPALFDNELILVKGARIFEFENIVQRLQRKIHGTVMEIDLNKMVHNLNIFKSKLNSKVKIMAMVKAFAYGSGSVEIANLLQYHKVDYLGVAYTDEAVELRKNNISLPILVMNITEDNFHVILNERLEPVIYNIRLLKKFAAFLEGREATIHLEIDTGMHRLGFEKNDWEEAILLLKQHPNILISSVFSHLAGADECIHDGFSKHQFDQFTELYQHLCKSLSITPLRHILNSAGILRFPSFQMDMVRLGIGLYGVNPTEENSPSLQPIATLKTAISQIRKIKKGDTIGYGRNGKATHDMTLATIAIGYADGFSRRFSQGRGKVHINGNIAPVIGNVCMDMTMVDVTNIPVEETDEVIIFGNELSLQKVAASIDTIPYEILTSISERVKRVFFIEGI